MPAFQTLIVSALSLVLGVLFIVLGSTVVENHNALPLLCLIFYVFAPVPFFLCGFAHRDSDFSSRRSFFQLIGLFIGGAFTASGPCLALVLYHVGSISRSAMLLTLASGLCFLISAKFLLGSSAQDESDDDEAADEDDLFE